MVRPLAPKLLVYLFLVFLSFLYCCCYHILMLNLTFILFVIIVNQPCISYPRARFVFVLLRYVHEKKFLLLLLSIDIEQKCVEASCICCLVSSLKAYVS